MPCDDDAEQSCADAEEVRTPWRLEGDAVVIDSRAVTLRTGPVRKPHEVRRVFPLAVRRSLPFR
jgi:hypothetical protein